VRKQLYSLLYFVLPLRRCRFVTTISTATRDRLIERFPAAAGKTRIIPDCVPDGFAPKPRPINTERPRILQIGTRPNKNLERVAQALQGLPYTLHVIGPLGEQQRSLLNALDIQFESSVDLSDTAFIQACERADIVAFVSLAEGFGMPIIEAQSIGRPVITSDVAPMNETAGDGACLVDPFSIDDIRAGIVRIVSDDSYRDGLIQKGFKNVTRFSRQTIAAKYSALYEEILSQPRHQTSAHCESAVADHQESKRHRLAGIMDSGTNPMNEAKQRSRLGKVGRPWMVFAMPFCFAISLTAQHIDNNPGVGNQAGVLSDVAQPPFPTFYAACNAAGSAGMVLAITKTWEVGTSATCAAPLAFNGGKIRPAPGQTVTFKVQSAPLSTICDISAGGACNITGPAGEVYPPWWGATGDRTTDVTVQFQAAINGAIAASSKLHLTPGGYVVSASLAVTDVDHFLMVGSGPSQSRLIWKGTGSGLANTALTVSNCYRCSFRDFGIFTDGMHRLDFGIVTQQVSRGVHFMTQPQFDNLWITDQTDTGKLQIGVYVHVAGAGDFQNDFHQYNRVIISNVAGAGWLIEGFNDHGIEFKDSLVYGGQCAVCAGGPITVASGTYGLGYSAYFRWEGGFVSGQKVANFWLSTTSGRTANRIEGVGSEESNRFLATVPPFGSALPVPVDLQNIRFASEKLNADGKAIIHGTGGPFHLADSWIGSDPRKPVTVSLGGNTHMSGATKTVERTIFTGSETTVTGIFPDALPDWCLACAASQETSSTTFSFLGTLTGNITFKAGGPVEINTLDAQPLKIQAGADGTGGGSLTLLPGTGHIALTPFYGDTNQVLCILDGPTGKIGVCSPSNGSSCKCQ